MLFGFVLACVFELLSGWCGCTSCGMLIVLGSSFSYFDFIVYLLWQIA